MLAHPLIRQVVKIKRCSKCGVVQPLSDFSHDRSKKDGLCSLCKECKKAFYKTNKEKKSEYNKEYYRTNKEKLKKIQKEYRRMNKEQIKQQQKEYFKTPNGKLTTARSNHNRHSFYRNERSDMTPARWAKILESQNNKCNVCHKRFSKKRPPTQDHIVPISKKGSLLSVNIQALCSSCNSTKQAKVDRAYIQT